MAGLLALLTILAGAPARLEGKPLVVELAATAAGLERQLVGIWVPPPEAVRQLLDLAKQGERTAVRYRASWSPLCVHPLFQVGIIQGLVVRPSLCAPDMSAAAQNMATRERCACCPC